MSRTQKISITAFALFAPLLSFAQFTGGNNELTGFGAIVINFINQTLVPLVFAVALLLFIYGAYLYFIQGGGEDDSRKQGKTYILYAIITFVVMVSVWGITTLIANGLGFSDQKIDDNIPDALTPAATAPGSAGGG